MPELLVTSSGFARSVACGRVVTALGTGELCEPEILQPVAAIARTDKKIARNARMCLTLN